MLATAPPPAAHDAAGSPGRCCVPGCGRPAPTQLCKRCFAVHADPDGTLPPWLLALRREATRLAVAEYRAHKAGYVLLSYEGDGVRTQRAILGGSFAPPRRLHRKGVQAPPLAPQVTEHIAAGVAADLWVGDPLALLRRHSHWGVPLDMPAFLALLADLFGWPPPGTVVDTRHKEALIDLYEKVYEA